MKDKQLNIQKTSKLFALMLNIYNPKENFKITQNYFKSENPSDLINSAQKTDCDILGLRFNIKGREQIQEAKELLKALQPQIAKPLMLCGTGEIELDKELIPELTKILDKEDCIISNATERTYKQILPPAIEKNFYVVLKSPIDINLAKELNILSLDLGLKSNRIIINTDIGGLGYGYEYGYSIMEKIRIEASKGETYLNFPILSEAPIESLKSKEAKNNDFTSSWGTLPDRARMIEIASASGILSAGANIIVMASPESISTMKGLL